MARTLYEKTVLTGGTAAALDGIDGSTLVDGDFCFVMTSANAFYTYVLDDDSAAAESVPTVIAPDTSPGDKRWILQNYSGADFLPSVDNTYSLGSASYRWANIYTGDLHLCNDKGDWTIQEGADELYIVNNKTGKRYAFVLAPK